MPEKKPKVEYVEDIKYENYCDAFVVSYKEGAFSLVFGQAIETPSKMFVRIWTDAPSFKILLSLFQRQLEAYEKQHGKIK